MANEIEEVQSSHKNSPRLVHNLALSVRQKEVLGAWYKDFEPIGTGRYGNVFKCTHNFTEENFAVKVIPIPEDEKKNGVPGRIIREVSALKELNHVNIVRLEDMLPTEDEVFLVFEYLDTDLHKFLRNPLIPLYPEMMKNFVHQILSAVAYCHSRKVLHRDLKPRNILFHFRTHILKIADFGAARTFDLPPSSSYSNDVGSSCYRAPELLFGSANYSTPIDVWSVGCIFGEMALGRPLFCTADSDWKMLSEIFDLLGTPTEETWPGVTSLCHYIEAMGPAKKPKDLAHEFDNKLDKDGIDLLSKLLRLCPNDRISAEDAVMHQYFKGI